MPRSDKLWYCAQSVWQEVSEVVPGCRFLNKDIYHPISADTKLPPEWCERPLEQTILDPNEKVNIESHEQKLVYDGNGAADNYVRSKHEFGVNKPQRRTYSGGCRGIGERYAKQTS